MSERRLDPRIIAIRERMKTIDKVLLIASGKGGVGKSIFSVSTALAYADKGLRAGILDLDLHGPVVPMILGVHDRMPSESREGLIPPKVYGVEMMSLALFVESSPLPLRLGSKAEAILELLAITRWSNLDRLIVDLPPGTGDEMLTTTRLLRDKAFAIVMTTPSKVAVATVKRLIALLRELRINILGLVENMSRLTQGKVELEIFRGTSIRELAKESGIEYLGDIPIDPTLESAIGNPRLIMRTKFFLQVSKIVDKIEKLIASHSTTPSP
ncbi:MAG: ATP-binding protein [Thermoprotei archaeon]|nr:MAG: ATP-binding protein [Thermoprotei archaeon]